MRIALIHAVQLAMEPIDAAFQRHWAEVDRINILDDSLSVDHAKAGRLTDDMRQRFLRLGRHAQSATADAILFTCSAFGAAIDDVAAALDVPVLKPNEAMFETALSAGGTVGLLASFAPSIPPMQAEFEKLANDANTPVRLECVSVEAAMAALRRGDGAEHDRMLAAGAQQLRACETIMLAQFSTARAQAAVADATGKRVLTSPDSAVLALKSRLCPDQS